jgi:hypothetical protein
MRLFNNEKGVSEVVGAMMVLFILVLYLGILQTYDVPRWNTQIERTHFDQVYSDFVTLRSNLEDVSVKNIPKSSSLHMGVKYPDRFMLQNPGVGANGILSTYPLRINISYENSKGIQWKNYSSKGIIYQQMGISDSPKLIYENGLMMKDYGNGHVFSVDEKQSLTSKDNIFIPILDGLTTFESSMDIETLNIQPTPNEGFSQIKFSSMNVTIETRYPQIWNNLSKESRPEGSNFTVENGTKCPYVNSDCLKLAYIPGYNVKKLNLPTNKSQTSFDQMYMSMVSFDNSLLNSRGPTGPDGQDMWEKNQGRLDIPAANLVKEFIIQDITLGRVENRHHDDYEHEDDHHEHESDKELKFSVTDSKNHLWTVEINFLGNASNLQIEYVKQNYPGHLDNHPDFHSSNCGGHGYNSSLPNVCDGTYTEFTSVYITDTRMINLTKYYQKFSNITSPNALTIDSISPEILYVNFRIN